MAKIVLVTGANRGIGLEVARQLAARRLCVIVSARDPAKASAAARSIAGDVHAVQLAVTQADSVGRAARDIESRFGGVDVLINNAAILLSENRDLLETSMDDFRRTFDTNVFGALAVSQACVPGMVTRGYGRIVNVSSPAGQLSYMNACAPASSISKAALNALTRQLAAATSGTGVLVNSACPGWVRTDMGGRRAPRSVEEGADTIVWLATLPDE